MAELIEGHLKPQDTLRQNKLGRNVAVPVARTVLVRELCHSAVYDAHFMWITQLIQEVFDIQEAQLVCIYKYAMCMNSVVQHGLCLVNVFFFNPSLTMIVSEPHNCIR